MYAVVTAPKPKRILVVRLGAMGDIIHTLPAVVSLCHSFPDSEVTWAVAPKWAPLIDGVGRLLEFDRRTIRGIAKAWSELRDGHFDLVVDFQGLLQSALIARCTGSKNITGYDRSQAREGLAALFYSTTMKTRAVHVVDKNLELARAAGAQYRLHEFPLPEGEPEGELPAGPYVLACPLAGWASKQWPLEFYSDVAARLDMPLVVNGSPSASEQLRSIAGTHVHLSGIPGLIHATRRAYAVIGVDSGPLHLAAALSKPGVAIFGPTDPARNGPYGKSITVLRAQDAVTSYKRGTELDPAMRAIRPEQVIEALSHARIS